MQMIWRYRHSRVILAELRVFFSYQSRLPPINFKCAERPLLAAFSFELPDTYVL